MGRKKGGHNKPKIAVSRQEQAIPLDFKEVKRQIRLLRKIKKDTRCKTDERRELNEKIRNLKKQLLPILKEADNPEKQKLIDEIIAFNKKYRPYLLEIGLNFTQYTMEKLRKHLEYLKAKRI